MRIAGVSSPPLAAVHLIAVQELPTGLASRRTRFAMPKFPLRVSIFYAFGARAQRHSTGQNAGSSTR